jgi:hypothetical protein
MTLMELAKDCWLFLMLMLTIVALVIQHDIRKEKNESPVE